MSEETVTEESKQESNIEELAEKWMQDARKNFRNDGFVVTTALLPTKEALVCIPLSTFCEKWGDEVGKIAFGSAIRKVVNDGSGCDYVGMIVESWVSKIDMNEYEDYEGYEQLVQELYSKHGSMEHWPKHMRKESIMVNVESRDGNGVSYMCDIDEETRELGEVTKVPTGAVGRMANWFGIRPDTPEGYH